jgi:hypothetical protein
MYGSGLKFVGNDDTRNSPTGVGLTQYQDSFPDSEPFEEEIFNDVLREERLCAQCGQDHSFRPNFKSVKTSIEHIPELIPFNFMEDSMKIV